VCNIPGNFEASEGSSFGFIRQFANTRTICEFGHDRMPAKAEDVDDMRRTRQSLHSNSIDSIMFKVRVFKIVIESNETIKN
jgi:hypothetical protein